MTSVAVVQMAMADDKDSNLTKAESLVRQAAAQGANIVLLPELFTGPYFPKQEHARFFDSAESVSDSPTIARMSAVAKDLRVVLPVSFFERDGTCYYNSIAIIDADGTMLGCYRKSHIPDGPGYEEKFYFRPGNTGFRVWQTQAGCLGVGICWDQWFPEAARIMTLLGAELLLYPTAIGSEPEDPGLDTKDRWERAMVGHAVCNVIPVAAANRIGSENGQVFYGSSFIADHQGQRVAALNRTEEGVALHEFDFSAIRSDRDAFGFFRDRRPELYHRLCE